MTTIDFDNKFIFILDNDQPTTCPMCGARTEFYDIKFNGEVIQYHICLDDDCFFSFLGEHDNKYLLAHPHKNVNNRDCQ